MDECTVPLIDVKSIHPALKKIALSGNTAGSNSHSNQYRRFFTRLERHLAREPDSLVRVLEEMTTFLHFVARQDLGGEGHKQAYRFIADTCQAEMIRPAFKAELLVELIAHPVRAAENLVPQWELLVRDALAQDNKGLAQLMVNYAVNHSNDDSPLLNTRALRLRKKIEVPLSAPAELVTENKVPHSKIPTGRRVLVAAGVGAVLALAASITPAIPRKRHLYGNDP
jgi:hypothetical protein